MQQLSHLIKMWGKIRRHDKSGSAMRKFVGGWEGQEKSCTTITLKRIEHPHHIHMNRTWLVDSLHRSSKKLIEDKDSENTKRSTKVAKELFYEYLKEKNIQEPHDKNELAQVLKSFYMEVRKNNV